LDVQTCPALPHGPTFVALVYTDRIVLRDYRFVCEVRVRWSCEYDRHGDAKGSALLSEGLDPFVLMLAFPPCSYS
jgi:hypothetical protein